MGERIPPLDHHMLPSKIPSAKNELQLAESLAKVVWSPKSSQTLPATGNAIDKIPQYYYKALLLKTPHNHVIEHGENKLPS